MNTDNTPKPLEFRIGQEFVPVEESSKEFDKSLFREIYQKTFDSIDDYMRTREEKKERNELNNIFAFVGERGSGKSSCMRSVAKMLTQKPSNELQDQGAREFLEKNWPKFHLMDTVDPSMFKQDNNILQLVVGKLFREFKKVVDAQNTEAKGEYHTQKRDLVELFEKVHRDITTLFDEHKESSNESIDALLALSASYDLQENFKKLVDKYLKFFDKDKDSVLVIQVDDIDLQTRFAFDMVEQIRKYMMHPNVVILMAVRMAQLEDVITKEYVREFRLLLDNELMTKGEPVEMSERYLGKLIPHQRRFYLPNMEAYFSTSVEIIDQERDGQSKEVKELFATVRGAVLTLIYRKTRFLFYNSKGVTSYIVPRNLRELRSLIRLLHDMEDYRVDKNGQERAEEDRPQYNKLLLQRYFMDTWLKSNLEPSDIQNIRDIWASDAAVANKRIVRLLPFDSQLLQNAQYTNKDYNTYERLAQIIDDKNSSYNVSVADVVYCMSVFKSINTDARKDRFLFAIQTVYSMILYGYYDELTDIKPKYKNPEIVKCGYLDNEYNYKKVAGLSFIPSYDDIIPSSRSAGVVRAQRSIDGDKVSKLFEDERTYKLGEFLILNISRRNEVKRRGEVQYDYRKNTEWAVDFHTGRVKNLWFDPTAFSRNLPFIEEVYQRHNVPDQVKKAKGSLYTTFQSIKYQNYRSAVCFRNIEVLMALYDYLRENRPEGSSNDAQVYKEFYEKASKFEIKTYDKDKNGQDYCIKFDFLNKFAQAIADNDLFDFFTMSDSDTPDKEQISGSIHSDSSKKMSEQTEGIRIPKFSGVLPEGMYFISDLVTRYVTNYRVYQKVGIDARRLNAIIVRHWPVDIAMPIAHNVAQTMMMKQVAPEYNNG